MRLFLIRHGQSLANTVMNDIPDSALTAYGVNQAVITAHYLSQIAFDHILASPLIRCLATAERLADKLDLPIQVWADLVEVRTEGRYIGPPRSELMQQFPRVQLPDTCSEDGWIYSGGEEDAESFVRAQRVIQRLREEFADKTCAVFAHGTFNSFLIQVALGLNGETPMRFRQSNCCINVLDLEDDWTGISVINSRCHLPEAAFGLPGWMKDHLSD